MNFQTMNISAFEKLCGVTPRTLKHYEDCGLLRPAAVGENGYREYTLSQVDRVSAILLLRGTYQMDAAGDLLLSGRRLCVYSRAMPPDWKTAMRSLLDAFAERTTAKPDFVYSETVIDEFSLGDGLMFYYLFLPE